ncbi:hypothetical protein A6R70_01755 [Agrobacterium rubi]|nr:hypothetical protein [Agrobacterium rubi]
MPQNCRPTKKDILVLSFGEIDCRVHMIKQAVAQGTTTRKQVDLLCDRFALAVEEFRNQCPAQIAISCILPPARIGLALGDYPSEEACFDDAKAIRDQINLRLSKMAPLVDFRAFFTDTDGWLNERVSDGNVHIDSRNVQPVLDALNQLFGTKFVAAAPVWPNVGKMKHPEYMSPFKRFRRQLKGILFAHLRKMKSLFFGDAL